MTAALRTEWASNAKGHGAGPYEAANMMMEPNEEVLLDEATADLISPTAATAGTWSILGEQLWAPSAQTASIGGGRTHSSLANFPGGPKQSSALGFNVTNSWPSAEHQKELSTGASGLQSGGSTAILGLHPRPLTPVQQLAAQHQQRQATRSMQSALLSVNVGPEPYEYVNPKTCYADDGVKYPFDSGTDSNAHSLDPTNPCTNTNKVSSRSSRPLSALLLASTSLSNG